jgi:hypothetical protein
MDNAEKFKKDGYVIIRNAVSKELGDFFTQYALFDEMQDFTKEITFTVNPQVPNAHSRCNDPATETLLLKLHPVMEEHTGLTLYPTYSYYRIYRKGDELKPHRDRPACEISTTVCFNYSYGDSYKWPIFIEGVSVTLYPGDMVIYKGCDSTHWREKFNIADDNAWHVQGFFHFVNADGVHADQKFDKRTQIGEDNGKPAPRAENKPVKSYVQYTQGSK